MAKREGAKKKGFLQALTDSFLDLITGNLADRMREFSEASLSKIREKYEAARAKLIKALYSLFFCMLALIFIAISAVHTFQERMQLTESMSYLFVGLILLVIGLTIKLSNAN